MAKQQQGQGGDNSLAPLWIAVLTCLAGYLIWQNAHKQIVSLVFALNIFEAKMVNFFLNQDFLTSQIYLMQTVDPGSVSFNDLMQYTNAVGFYVRYPVIVILAVIAIFLYSTSVKLKYRKSHDMKSLRAQEQQNWSSIMPVVKLDLSKEDINQGIWAMALSPMEFAHKHKLLKKEDMLLNTQTPGLEMTAGVRRGDAKRVFTLQLGAPFENFEQCSPYVKALAAVFMARLNRDRDAATTILKTLDQTVTAGKPNYAIAIPTLKKYQNSELVQKAISGHAYLLTVLAALLAAARDDGVVASAEFLWLKTVDRRLWYMLNCVGRQTPYAEVAGPIAHWKAEIALGRKSLVPMVDEAIKALEIAIKEVRLKPEQLQELEP